MKKLFPEEVYDILECEQGFIVVYKKAEVEGKTVVGYKSVSLGDGIVTQRTRADYEFVKFGERHTALIFENDNIVTCNCVRLEGDRLFIIGSGGAAKIVDSDGYIEWQGVIKYKDCGPASVVSHGHTLWASFPSKNSLIRFNLRTMREELRIGGSNDSSFAKPSGMWVDGPSEKLLVCNVEGKNILEVNMKTYTVVERAVFDEPVYKYMRIGTREFVVLESGLYLL